ncbi:signaling mucin HKR1-like [Coregonus clupeaformis]|uniref:signaling mucin HKR1-like n=1 Tax=Coregonus clupeaformis TaxID=59861 RepID=UPI001E1C6DF4|nr:signaling mucin HKR1-like [Coregonus clupeaformis]
MKDIALSLLSRGCGHVAQSHLGSQDGRLEVCFEPEDYYLWKSQPSLLRLSKSGRLLGGVEPALPKTYSTRRGPLFLYYEEMAMTSSVLSSCPSGSEDNRKRWASHHSRQEVELQLNTLRDLTGAILAYGNNSVRKEKASLSCPSPPVSLSSVRKEKASLSCPSPPVSLSSVRKEKASLSSPSSPVSLSSVRKEKASLSSPSSPVSLSSVRKEKASLSSPSPPVRSLTILQSSPPTPNTPPKVGLPSGPPGAATWSSLQMIQSCVGAMSRFHAPPQLQEMARQSPPDPTGNLKFLYHQYQR